MSDTPMSKEESNYSSLAPPSKLTVLSIYDTLQQLVCPKMELPSEPTGEITPALSGYDSDTESLSFEQIANRSPYSREIYDVNTHKNDITIPKTV